MEIQQPVAPPPRAPAPVRPPVVVTVTPTEVTTEPEPQPTVQPQVDPAPESQAADPTIQDQSSDALEVSVRAKDEEAETPPSANGEAPSSEAEATPVAPKQDSDTQTTAESAAVSDAPVGDEDTTQADPAAVAQAGDRVGESSGDQDDASNVIAIAPDPEAATEADRGDIEANASDEPDDTSNVVPIVAPDPEISEEKQAALEAEAPVEVAPDPAIPDLAPLEPLSQDEPERAEENDQVEESVLDEPDAPTIEAEPADGDPVHADASAAAAMVGETESELVDAAAPSGNRPGADDRDGAPDGIDQQDMEADGQSAVVPEAAEPEPITGEPETSDVAEAFAEAPEEIGEAISDDGDEVAASPPEAPPPHVSPEYAALPPAPQLSATMAQSSAPQEPTEPGQHSQAVLDEAFPREPAQPPEPEVNSELEAELGDMFATPPEVVERQSAPGAPVRAPDIGAAIEQPPTRITASIAPTPDALTAPEPPSISPPAPVRAERPAPVRVPRRMAQPSPDQERAIAMRNGTASPPAEPYYSEGAGYGEAAGGGAQYHAPSFATPDEIAPDPAFERSHIDNRTDAPFTTDFSDDLPPTMPVERRGSHIHENLQRRRAAVTLGWFCLAAIVGTIIGILTLARDSVIEALPGTAGLYAAFGQSVNIRGLDFKDVSYDWTTDKGRPAIDVKGKIRNVSGKSMEVPTVVFVLLDDRGDELYNWASRVREEPIEAGGEAQFEARVPAPPGTARRLRVRFARKTR